MLMRKALVLVSVSVFMAALWLGVSLPQASAQEEEPVVVFAVLFYSPSCPHCHLVLTETYPALEQEFGDQLQVLFIDVSTAWGGQMAFSAYEVYAIPDEMRGVPMMILGSDVMVGGIDIPQRAPGLIRDGIAAGGVDLPPIPGLREAYEEAVALATQEAEESLPSEEVAEAPSDPDPAPQNTAPPEEEIFGEQDSRLAAKLARDPLGNALAVVVLVGLAAGVGTVIAPGLRGRSAPWFAKQPGRLVTLATALGSFAVAATLVANSGGGSLATTTALVVTLALFVVAFVVARKLQSGEALPSWLLVLVAGAGLLVAIYMAYVEVSQTEAVCGAVGDCNTVQHSIYARLFGLLPIGVLGVVGYVLILLVWLVGQSIAGNPARLAQVALLGMALFGTLFSVYLTFLEPFVIGATCAWCLTSALTMLLLLWLVAPEGWQATRSLTRPSRRRRRRA